MIANINDNPILGYNQPRSNTVINYEFESAEKHYQDGWREVTIPPYDPDTEQLGEFIRVGDGITRAVEPIPPEEMEQRKIAIASTERREKLAQETERLAMKTFIEITDEQEVIKNQEIYSIWEKLPDGFKFQLPFYVQAIQDENLKVFRLIQPHAKQMDWHPTKVPALWGLVNPVIDGFSAWLPFEQSQTTYPTGAKVTHKAKNWESTTPNNVWEPGVFGWKEI